MCVKISMFYRKFKLLLSKERKIFFFIIAFDSDADGQLSPRSYIKSVRYEVVVYLPSKRRFLGVINFYEVM